jgi:hypothetical protein
MLKIEMKIVVDELRNHKYYENIDIVPLFGIGLSDFPKGKYVTKEAIVNFLGQQCRYFNGGIDENELTNCLFLLKEKRVIMV